MVILASKRVHNSVQLKGIINPEWYLSCLEYSCLLCKTTDIANTHYLLYIVNKNEHTLHFI